MRRTLEERVDSAWKHYCSLSYWMIGIPYRKRRKVCRAVWKARQKHNRLNARLRQSKWGRSPKE